LINCLLAYDWHDAALGGNGRDGDLWLGVRDRVAGHHDALPGAAPCLKIALVLAAGFSCLMYWLCHTHILPLPGIVQTALLRDLTRLGPARLLGFPRYGSLGGGGADVGAGAFPYVYLLGACGLLGKANPPRRSGKRVLWAAVHGPRVSLKVSLRWRAMRLPQASADGGWRRSADFGTSPILGCRLCNRDLHSGSPVSTRLCGASLRAVALPPLALLLAMLERNPAWQGEVT